MGRDVGSEAKAEDASSGDAPAEEGLRERNPYSTKVHVFQLSV